jgi:CheY-like chemotaxis protein
VTKPAEETARGHETVLLVEDDQMVRDLMKIILQDHGYSVLTAGHGQEALVTAAQTAQTIDLLITDVVMPQMGGRELAEQLTARQPSLKLLFTSGYTDDAVVRHGVLTAGVHFLAKPFMAKTLLTKVRQILDDEPRPLP